MEMFDAGRGQTISRCHKWPCRDSASAFPSQRPPHATCMKDLTACYSSDQHILIPTPLEDDLSTLPQILRHILVTPPSPTLQVYIQNYFSTGQPLTVNDLAHPAHAIFDEPLYTDRLQSSRSMIEPSSQEGQSLLPRRSSRRRVNALVFLTEKIGPEVLPYLVQNPDLNLRVVSDCSKVEYQTTGGQ